MPIRIKGLASGTLTQAKTVLYTVPVAKEAILETIVAAVLDTSVEASAAITFWVRRSGSTTSVPLSPLGYGVEKSKNVFVFESSIALAAGDVIEGKSTGAALVGYDFSGMDATV